MAASEYLAFLPLLIYGIALADLFSEWKRLFNPKGLFIPYSLFTIILTEIAVYNVFVFAELLSELDGITYYNYLSYLLPPFIFLLTVNIYTPEKDTDTKTYFIKQMPVFFTLMALFSASHFLYDFSENTGTLIIRLVSIAMFAITGFSRKVWMTYALAVVWLILLIFRIGIIST
ncbi:MAG: hypothetical protein ABFS32_19130 [Bacteroidota bacterium]